MKPFEVSDAARLLAGCYPKPDELRHVARNATRPEKAAVVRQWISEGIPYAFKECPMLYEAVRKWLARKIEVHPKEITLIGSARIGYCLAPPPGYGEPFGDGSDLDFSVISKELFERCREAFELWRRDYRSGTLQPRNSNEESYWDENLKWVPKNIERGFIDPWKIPIRTEYPIACLIENSLWQLKEKLWATGYAPQLTRASSRVYRDWRAFVRQLEINLSNATKDG